MRPIPTFIRVQLRQEIIADFSGERLDYWVTGYGTGGTLKGVARVLAKGRPETKIVVCEPADARLLSSGSPQLRHPTVQRPHRIPPSNRISCRGGRPISSQN